MAIRVHLLTAAAVRTAKAGFHHDGGGLYLQVSAAGAKSWIFRYRADGRQRHLGLGSGQTIGLTEARRRAVQAKADIASGSDPIAQRGGYSPIELKRALSFRDAAQACMTALGPDWTSPAYAAQWRSSFRMYVFPHIGDLAVSNVDTAAVLRVLEPVWNTKPATANRVRLRVHTVLAWCAARGLRSPENPARWTGHLEMLLPRRSRISTVQHYEALPYAQIADLLCRIRKQPPTPAYSALELTILTAVRSGAVIGCVWGEFDLDEAIWTISADRMKTGRTHRVPLSTSAVALLRRTPASGDPAGLVFPGIHQKKPLHDMAMVNALRRVSTPELTVHGFRSTFRDWVAEETDFPSEVADMALAHVVANKVEAAYRRGDLFAKRQALMQAWDLYCSGQPSASHGRVMSWAMGSFARTLGWAKRLGAAA